MDNETILEVQNKIDKIDSLIQVGQYEKAAALIEENKLFLQQNADMKSQNLLNKKYALCIFHIVRASYKEENDEIKFINLFEKNRALIEVHHKKADYLELLKIYNKIKRKKKNKIMMIAIPLALILLGSAIFFAGESFTGLIFSPKDIAKKEIPKEIPKETSKEAPKEETVTEVQPPATTDSTKTPPAEDNTDGIAAEDQTEAQPPNEEKDPSEDYILDSAGKMLTLDDVKDMNATDIRLAINEMYARHGYYFGGYNQTYFESKTWYKPDKNLTNPADVTKNFSDIENANLSFLAQRERALKGN